MQHVVQQLQHSAVPAVPPANIEGGISTDQIRLWGIPYKIIDRTGYDLTFPTAVAHEQGDHIFLNAAHMHDIYAAANLANTALALPDIDI